MPFDLQPLSDLVVTVTAPACALGGSDGQIRATGVHGLFVADRRVLAEALLRVGGVEPTVLVHGPEGVGRTRFIGIDQALGDPGADPTVRVERARHVRPDGMAEEIVFRSTATAPVRTTVTVDLRCDLTPVQWARSGRTRPAAPAELDGAALRWSVEGVVVTARGDGARLTAGAPGGGSAGLEWDVDLPPGGEATLRWEVHARGGEPVVVAPRGPVEWSRPRLVDGDPRLRRLLARSLDDLEALRLAEATDPDTAFVGAGAPWFLTLFGRDSLWAARMLLPLGTGIAESTLRVLARRQGEGVDDVTGEAPGKIMHELRHEGIRLVPGALPARYYGTVDATPLWISLLADAWRWGLPEESVAALLPHLDRALSWLWEQPDGLLRYVDRTGRGLANQGWKDSGDAVRFHDGSLARPPIALCEVQGYAHRAALDAAELMSAFDVDGGDRWLGYAAALAERFRERFWVSGGLGPYPAMALDRDGRPVDSLTSNIGHLLGTGILSTVEEASVARVLAAPPMSGGYGLRTMSTLDKGFAPLSYHCGSIWPHDTAIAVLGLAGAGAPEAAAVLIDGLLEASDAFGQRLPELYGGDDRSLGRPVPYPHACRPQAWSAAASVTVLQAILGVRPDAHRGEVWVRPLPGVGPVEVRGLRIAGAPVQVSVAPDGAVSVTGLPGWLRWSSTSAHLDVDQGQMGVL